MPWRHLTLLLRQGRLRVPSASVRVVLLRRVCATTCPDPHATAREAPALGVVVAPSAAMVMIGGWLRSEGSRLRRVGILSVVSLLRLLLIVALALHIVAILWGQRWRIVDGDGSTRGSKLLPALSQRLFTTAHLSAWTTRLLFLPKKNGRQDRLATQTRNTSMYRELEHAHFFEEP